jgi:hypothetical protein
MANVNTFPEFVDLKARFAERLAGTSALESVSRWICEHTSLEDKKFSFKNHEFQSQIADDLSPTVVVQKPTQVGMTELSVRIMLALCGIRRNFKVIYILPSAKFAGEFAKTRVDPIVETSTRLSAMVVKGADGAMMKRIGTSTMYMGGAATKGQAISRPADALFMDEVDFANQEVLTSYEGRLAHALNPMRRKFSTPTLSGYGINKELLVSDRHRYMVKCEHCSTWQAPNFNKDVHIPGFEGEEFKVFTKEHLMQEGVNIHEAVLLCQKCKKPLDGSLRDPERRQWVPQVTEVQTVRGYEVKPFDLPVYNTTPTLISRFANYADEEDYWNFCQGEVYDSEENQVNTDIVSSCFTLPAQQVEAINSLCMGVDVGKHRCHVMVGKGREVFFRYTLRIENGEFLDQIKELYIRHKCIQGVIDIGPDSTLSRGLHTAFGSGFMMCAYRKDVASDPWYYTLDEGKGVISMQRTKGFNMLVKDLNRKGWRFTPGSDKAEVLSQFLGMKRLKKDDTDEGERTSVWEKTGDDHYLHALMYLQVAIHVAEGAHKGVSSVVAAPMLPGIGGVTIHSGHSSSELTTRDIFSMFHVH